MKALLFGLVSLVAVSSFAGVPGVSPKLSCDYVREQLAAKQVTVSENVQCAASDKTCQALQRQQITAAATTFNEPTAAAKTEVSDKAYQQILKDFKSPSFSQIRIGELTFDDAVMNLPFSKDVFIVSDFIYVSGTTEIAPMGIVHEYDDGNDEIFVSGEACGALPSN